MPPRSTRGTARHHLTHAGFTTAKADAILAAIGTEADRAASQKNPAPTRHSRRTLHRFIDRIAAIGFLPVVALMVVYVIGAAIIQLRNLL